LAEKGTAKPNVILVTSIRPGRPPRKLRRHERPDAVLDGLARRGVLFEQAATASPLTLPAHCTILTGMYPTYHGVRVNGNTA